MSRILGIDPGSRVTGYAVIDCREGSPAYVDSGCIRTAGDALPQRLEAIWSGVREVMALHGPEALAIERVFMHRNADSALKLGHARGVAIMAAVLGALPVHEYTATQVKQAVVGRGHATKQQVQHMVQALLALARCPQADAADALAVAVCHAHTSRGLGRIPAARAARGGRLR